MSSPDPITTFFSKLGRYPGNNRQWWVARADVDDAAASPPILAGDFLPELLDKLFSGNMRAPKGHYVLDAFNKDRTFVSGIESIPAEVTNERPLTVAFFSGRVWFGCKSTVYFSQVLTEKHRAGLCFQEADPTSEYISDPVATDGGEIPIPEANKIIKLLPYGGGVLVFALNGVWYVTGTQAGFTALDISVNKVSPIGCQSPMSVVTTEKGVYYWSDVGIVGMTQSMGQFGPIPGTLDRTTISETTIQSLYNDIDTIVKQEVKGVFDPKANVVFWLFRDADVSPTQFNKVLIFDISLEAFYPWKFESLEEDSPLVKGLFISDRINTYTITTDIDPSQIEYIVAKDSSLRFAQARNGNFCDWEQEDGTGVGYDSYIETGFELFDDAMRDKNITYLFTYLTRTESELDEDDNPINPSSCYLTVKFDWASSGNSNKWTVPVQVYRPSRILFDSPDTGFGMVITKSKVRGNGKAIQFRFGTDEIGRNFDLHGWSIGVTGNVSP